MQDNSNHGRLVAPASSAPNGSTGSSASRSASEARKHRANVALQCQVILAQFWTAEDAEDELRGLELKNWTDVLVEFSPDEVGKAWIEYQKSGPRSEAGRLSRPDAGALYRIITKARANAAIATRRPAPPEQQLPPPPRVTAAQALKIIKDVGFRVKRFPEVGEGGDV